MRPDERETASVDYDDVLHRNYAEGRKLPTKTLDLWMSVAAEYLPPSAGQALTILDLGAGTGRFSVALAERLSGEVVGVEPSEKMRQQAQALAAHPRVRFAGGSAEAIPLPDASCDVAWLSIVLHHFQSVSDATAELFRVLRPGGRVLIRTTFRGRLDTIRFYEFFPEARALDERRLPDLAETIAAFEAAGFAQIAHREITQIFARSLGENYEKIKLRTVSSLELLTTEQFRRGLRAMKAAVEAECEPKPVTETVDFLVFEKA